jgi:hypothetical protein
MRLRQVAMCLGVLLTFTHLAADAQPCPPGCKAEIDNAIAGIPKAKQFPWETKPFQNPGQDSDSLNLKDKVGYAPTLVVVHAIALRPPGHPPIDLIPNPTVTLQSGSVEDILIPQGNTLSGEPCKWRFTLGANSVLSVVQKGCAYEFGPFKPAINVVTEP